MARTQVRRVRRTREQWEKLIRKYERGRAGLTQVQFAREQGLKLGSLRYWLWKLRGGGRRKDAGGRGKRERSKSATAVEFVEVTSTPVARASCRVLVGHAVAVELDTLPPAEWVRELAQEA